MNEREIFVNALLQPDAAARATYLDGVCGPDGEMRQRIDELLALHLCESPVLDRRPRDLLGELQEDHEEPTPVQLLQQLQPYFSPSTWPGASGRLGHYDILSVQGQGGFGIVLRAFDDTLQRVVAIKVLAPALAVTSPPRRRFLREARAAAAVRHDNVVQIYAVEERPIPYIVMEYIAGPTLQKKLDAEGPFSPEMVARLGAQMARGLAAAHAQNLIHRDIKPANMLLEEGTELRVKLTDFGLARTADDASLTASGVLAGTPLYMAPEQAQGDRLDHRADLFSLGSVLYTLAAGRPAFRAANSLAVMRRVAEDAPRPLREVNSDVPEGLWRVIARLLEKNPAKRYATAAEAAEALDQCLTSPVGSRKPMGRRWAVTAAVLWLAVLVVGAAAWWSLRPENDPTQDADEPIRRPSVTATVQPPPPPPTPDILVTKIEDDGTPGTLRWAVAQANASPKANLIGFDPTVFAAPKSISLTEGPLMFKNQARTTLVGPAAGLTIYSGKKSRLLKLETSGHGLAAVSIQDMTLVGGDLGIGNGLRGGLIHLESDLALTRVTVQGKYANFGGAIAVESQGILRLDSCTFLGIRSHVGGAIISNGTLYAVNCTFTRNRAEKGGALALFGPTTLVNCTITGNVGLYGAGIFGDEGKESLHAFNCIIAENRHPEGIENDLAVRITARNCLLGATEEAVILPESQGNLVGVSPRLGPLGKFSRGPETFSLLAGSPAIDAGKTSLLPPDVRTDQRGAARVAGATVDIGAFEAE